MIPKYKYKGNGTASFFIGTERYEVSTIVSHLRDTIELKVKLTKEELERIGVIELVEEDKKKTKRGEE